MAEEIDVSSRLLSVIKQDPELVRSSLDALEKIVFTLGRLNSEGKLDPLLEYIYRLANKVSELDESQRGNLARAIDSIIDLLASSKISGGGFMGRLSDIDSIFSELQKIYKETDRGLSIRELLGVVRSPEFARALRVFMYLAKRVFEE